MKVPFVSPEFIRGFADSLPDGYRDKYDADAIATHARIAAARGKAPANAGRFGVRRPEDATGVCVIAEDRPGLLSTISAALVLRGLDVASAEAYTRRADDGESEAVDLFWLRKTNGSASEDVSEADVEAVRESLIELLGKPSESVPPPEIATPSEKRTEAAPDAIVRFLDDSEGGLTTLEVETSDRSGLLLILSNALFQQRVQIVRSEVRTVGDRVFDRFTVVEFDGSPIGAARRLEIQVGVLNAIEPARRTNPPPMSS